MGLDCGTGLSVDCGSYRWGIWLASSFPVQVCGCVISALDRFDFVGGSMGEMVVIGDFCCLGLIWENFGIMRLVLCVRIRN